MLFLKPLFFIAPLACATSYPIFFFPPSIYSSYFLGLKYEVKSKGFFDALEILIYFIINSLS